MAAPVLANDDMSLEAAQLAAAMLRFVPVRMIFLRRVWPPDVTQVPVL